MRMYNEITITIGTNKYKAFLKAGFYQLQVTTAYLHKHNYTEIHIITGGTANYAIEDKVFNLKSGDMLVIPRDAFHCCTKKDDQTLVAAFQINREVKKAELYSIGTEISTDFLNEIKKNINSQNYARISAYISLFCSYFCSDSDLPSQSVTDYAFLIYEFFSANYAKDLKLQDLAEILHLSERQTERLVIEYTGKTFKEELITIRMNMAKKLLESSNMSLGDIAQYVGYRSYAGFYKAMKKFNIKP